MDSVRIFVGDWSVNGSIKENVEYFREFKEICKKPILEPTKVYIPHLQQECKMIPFPYFQLFPKDCSSDERWTLLVHSNIYI